MTSNNVSLIVAIDENNGIGKIGAIPWQSKEDMAYFKFLTKHTNSKDRRNVVIMGKRTWDSIPEGRRPLQGRINIIVTSTSQTRTEDAHFVRGSAECMELLQRLSPQVEKIFICGGESIYTEFLPQARNIFVTRVTGSYDCDTEFVDGWEATFTKVAEMKCPGSIPTIRHEVWERNAATNENGGYQ